MRRLLVLALPMMLIACGDAPGEDGAGGSPDSEASAAIPEEAILDLQATGIIVPAQNGFEQLAAPFGSNRAATETTLANVLGEQLEQGGPNDCGLAFASYRGLTLSFRDDTFVGYWAEAPYVDGLARADMLGSADVQLVEDSTLDHEFVIGDREGESIGGLFDGDGEDAGVRALWAGENCIAR